ncbi:MAG: hypothetical protein A2143_01780 [Gallionellales bacterium RBG_16_57_15]|nr:MAG: hypothetical protein A2143_01780 [Gallionellales bacterium RBG_16_57_15]
MKFLKDERIEREDGEVKLTIKPVTTSQQAHLLEIGLRGGVKARIDLSRWCLVNCIEKISITGAEFKPAQLAEQADLNDEGTMAVMMKIGAMVCEIAWLSGDDVKK